ncbi:MAG: RNase H family protein, partial [Fibrobacterota bacterium]
MKDIPKIKLFSDGGARPNPGPGGFGTILRCGAYEKEFSQGYQKTTNNRMELMGAITGLEKLKK